MNDLLQLDINEFVSDAIKDTIESLNKQVESERIRVLEQKREIQDLKNQLLNSEISLSLLSKMREQFAAIKSDEGGEYPKSKAQKQFLFIENILLNFFNIKKEYQGWLSGKHSGGLSPYLAVNFYSNKDTLIELIKVIMPNNGDAVSFLKNFKMPFDYTKDQVVKYVKCPKYNTNGSIFGVTNYWIEAGAGEVNMPHDLIMKNPFILDEDVFAALLESIDKNVSEHQYLFALPLHNKNISVEQIQALGERLIGRSYKGDLIMKFISENLLNFNTKTLDYLYENITHNNQFNTLHWEKFPNDYQMRFLKSKPLDFVLNRITHSSCTWTIEQKQHFLKHYTNL